MTRPASLHRFPYARLLAVLSCSATSLLAVGIERSSPLAVRPGKTVDVTFFGDELDGSPTLWTSFPCEATLAPDVDRNGSDPSRVTFRITVPVNVPRQCGGVRVVTRAGVSNLRLLLVDDLPTSSESPDASSSSTAQTVVFGRAIEGAADARRSDRYRFTVRKGQRVAVEAVAGRIGSSLDAVLRVLDESGREVAWNDDTPPLDGDACAEHTFDADGTCLVEIRDAQFRGGGDFFYRLRIGDFALAEVPSALGPRSERETPETEPNDTPESALHVELPRALHGRFDAPGDRDVWSFDVSKGERWRFRGRTWSLGAPSTLFLRLLDAKGARLAEAPQSGSDERIVDHTFDANGRFLLVVDELHRRGGPRYAYRIDASRDPAPFSLTLAAESFDAPENGVLVIKVACERRGYSGPIQLSIDDAGEGFSLRGEVIPKDAKDTALHVRLPGRLVSGSVSTLRIRGTARVEDTTLSTRASALAAVRDSVGKVRHPPLHLTQSVVVGVGPAFPEFFRVVADPPLARVVKGSDEATLRVDVERRSGFAGAVEIELGDLPEGVVADAANILSGLSSTDVTLRGTQALGVGAHHLRVRGSATFKNQPQTSIVEDVVLRVGPALELTITPPAAVLPGKRAKLDVDVIRFTGSDEPVSFQWRGLPDGVRAVGNGKLAKNERSASLFLDIDPTVDVEEISGVTLTATTSLPRPRPRGASGSSSLTELYPETELRKVARVIEAEKFQRGNVTVDVDSYGKGIGIISDPGAQLNYAEYDIESSRAGPYQVELRYAARTRRPGKLILNGSTVKDGAIGETTGSWMPDTQRWHVEGVFPFERAVNLLRIQSQPMKSHIDKLLIGTPARRLTLEATFDSWVDEGSGATAESIDGNLISVFASDGLTGKRRVGLVTFEASALAGTALLSAHLELGVDARGSRLATGPARSFARLLPPGTDAGALTHATYSTLLARSITFASFASFDIAEGKSRAAGQYERSGTTSAGDLVALQARLASTSRKSEDPSSRLRPLVIALEAREDGSGTCRDWGANDEPPKGTQGGPLPPRVVVCVDPRQDTADREPSTVTVVSKPITLRVQRSRAGARPRAQ